MSTDVEAVYCLGNDAVYDWLVALFTSLREHEGPMRRLILIPFDDNLARTRRLAAEFDVEIVQEHDLMWLDRLGKELRPESPVAASAMRKLFMFVGPAERFVFVDADAVLVSSIGNMFSAIEEHSDCFFFLDEDIDEVYLPGALREHFVSAGARGFNSGILGGTVGLLSRSDIEQAVQAAKPVRAEFASRYEQSFLNFLVHTSTTRAIGFRDVLPHLGGSWAGLRTKRDAQGRLAIHDRRWRHTSAGQRDIMQIVHWAGYRLDPAMPYRGVFCRYRAGAGVVSRVGFELSAWYDLLVHPTALARMLATIPRRLRDAALRFPRRRSLR